MRSGHTVGSVVLAVITPPLITAIAGQIGAWLDRLPLPDLWLVVIMAVSLGIGCYLLYYPNKGKPYTLWIWLGYAAYVAVEIVLMVTTLFAVSCVNGLCL